MRQMKALPSPGVTHFKSCACFFKVSDTIPAVMCPLSGISLRSKQELVKACASHRCFPHPAMSHRVQTR